VTAPTRSSYLTARQVTADILARTGGAPFVFEMFVEPQTEAFASPYIYLLKRAGAALTTQGDAMRVQVYDPATLAEGQGGEIFQTIRVVTFAPPSQLGPNLLDAEWNLHKRVVVTAENELELTAAEIDDALSATQRLPLKANATYLLQFECRNALERGDQRVYLQTLNEPGDVVQTFPNGAGYECPKTAEWTHGSILVRTAAETKRSIIFLRLYGVGTVWFRNVRLQKTSLEQLP
jgi:hypothetical protein